MRKLLMLAAVAASTLPALTAVSVPGVAAAQSWRYDPCRQERRESGRTGTVAGGVLGAVIGSQMAGRGSRTEGAIIGGTAGAVIGHEVGKSSVKCGAYPSDYRRHRGCRWVTDYSGRRPYSYEVCRGRDDNWRRYNRRDDRRYGYRYDY